MSVMTHHATAPSGCGVTLLWLWLARDDALEFDDDLLDAEIVVSRMGKSQFSTADLCDVFDCSRQTIVRWKQSGRVPEPKWPHEDDPRGDTYPDRWSLGQVAAMVADGLGCQQGKALVNA